MEDKTIQIEPKAAVEMQTWTNIYDRVPSQYKQYVSYPTTTMQECPCKSEIRDKFPESTTSSNELADYSSIGYTYKKSGQNQSLFEVLALDKGLLRVRPLSSNGTNMMRTCTVAVTAMGQTTYIYLSQNASPLQPTTPTSTN